MTSATPDWLVTLQAVSGVELSEEICRQVAAQPASALRIRNLLGLPALHSGDVETAWTVCTCLAALELGNAVFLLDKASLAVRLGATTEARAAALAVLAAEPADGSHAARALQVLLQIDDVHDAAEKALLLRPLWPANPRLAHMSLLALSRRGDRAEAAAAARFAVAGRPDDPGIAAAAADAFLHVGQARAAVEVLDAAGAGTSGDARALFELARAHAFAGQDEKAVEIGREALARAPGQVRVIELLARLLTRTGRRNEAEEMLLAIPEAKRTAAVTRRLVDVMSLRGAFADAAPLARKLLSEDPENLPLVRRMVGILMRAGQDREAQGIYEGVLGQRRSRLPADFHAAARALMDGGDPGKSVLPGHRLEWLCRNLAAKGAAPVDRPAWEDRVRRGLTLDLLVLDWIETRFDRIAEVIAMIDVDPTAEDALRVAQARGRGVVLATGHVGLIYAGLAAIHGTGLPATFVASTPVIGRGVDGVDLLSTSSFAEPAIVRGVLGGLRQGRVVTVAIDGATAEGKHRLTLFDRMIAVSDVVPRLAWRTGSASFFPLVVATHSGRMRAMLWPLPDPGDYAREDDFRANWLLDFSRQLCMCLVEHPDAARASGGFWRTITI